MLRQRTCIQIEDIKQKLIYITCSRSVDRVHGAEAKIEDMYQKLIQRTCSTSIYRRHAGESQRIYSRRQIEDLQCRYRTSCRILDIGHVAQIEDMQQKHIQYMQQKLRICILDRGEPQKKTCSLDRGHAEKAYIKDMQFRQETCSLDIEHVAQIEQKLQKLKQTACSLDRGHVAQTEDI